MGRSRQLGTTYPAGVLMASAPRPRRRHRGGNQICGSRYRYPRRNRTSGMGTPGRNGAGLARRQPSRLAWTAAALLCGLHGRSILMGGKGTADNPWTLKTPPGTAEYLMWRDDTAEPPVIVCQVGKTR